MKHSANFHVVKCICSEEMQLQQCRYLIVYKRQVDVAKCLGNELKCSEIPPSLLLLLFWIPVAICKLAICHCSKLHLIRTCCEM
jgi:hypothetical protein